MSVNHFEFIRAAKEYAAQQGIAFDTVVEAMEKAIQLSETKRYNYDKIKITIDRNTGRINAFKQMLVVKADDNIGSSLFRDNYQCLSIKSTLSKDLNAKEGDILLEKLPDPDLFRITTLFSRNVFIKALNEAIHDRQFNEFKDRVGEIVVGIVKRIHKNELIVDVHNVETTIPSINLIRGEIFRSGDRIKAYLVSVKRLPNLTKIFLSRTHPNFVVELFKQEIPEIYDGIITIKMIARSAGSRSKIAVLSTDSNIDPVGACIGMRGLRIQAIINELNGEKIDVVEYSEDPITLVIRALMPANVIKVVVDDKKKTVDVVVPDHQLSIAIGRGGQNVNLASALVGWKIDILSENNEIEKRKEEFRANVELLMKALDVEEIIAQLMVAEGFFNVKDIANMSLEDLKGIEGFDEELAKEIQVRAKSYLQNALNNSVDNRVKIDKNSSINLLPEITPKIFLKLAENNILYIKDLAELSQDEFREILGETAEEEGISNETIGKIIVYCRKNLGWIDN